MPKEANSVDIVLVRDETLLRVLEGVEWCVWDQGYRKCPICTEAEKYGHAKGCTLSAAIIDVRETLISRVDDETLVLLNSVT